MAHGRLALAMAQTVESADTMVRTHWSLVRALQQDQNDEGVKPAAVEGIADSRVVVPQVNRPEKAVDSSYDGIEPAALVAGAKVA